MGQPQPLNTQAIERHMDVIARLARMLANHAADRGTHGNALLLQSLEHHVECLREAFGA